MADERRPQLSDNAGDSIRSDLLRPRRTSVHQPHVQVERPLRVGPSLWGSASGGQSATLAWLFAAFIAIAVITGVLWYSSDSVLQLKPDPPAQFFAVAVHLPGDQRPWAHHYWQHARDIQSKYTYGKPLPNLPPVEFRISEESTVATEVAFEIRLAYWEQLQIVWLDPDSWETSRRWVSLATVRNWLDL